MTGGGGSSIEYRLMLEAGTVGMDAKRHWALEELVMDIDLAYRRCYQFFPDEMEALKTYYLRKKSYRAVGKSRDCSSYIAKRLVREGRLLLTGAVAGIAGFQRLS